MKTVLCVIALVLAASSAFPQAPRNAEMCNGWYKEWNDQTMRDMDEMAFVVASRPGKETIEKARELKIRILAYATFYQMPPNQRYQHANIAEHPDWNAITPEGEESAIPSASLENAGWKLTCPNSFGYYDYVLRTVRLIMAQGVDGIFIDNAHPNPICEGPKFSKHRHIYPDKDNIYAYRKLLEDIRAEVRKSGPDKLVIINPGGPRTEWVGACDGQMLESYICSWAWKNRWPESKILKFQQEWVSAAEKGSPVVALSYLGHTENPLREDAFYCYAWARLSGFIWADWFTGREAASDLYKVRIGKPLGPMKTLDGYYMREFEWGLVVATSETKGATFTISAKDRPRVLDVFNAQRLKTGPSGDYEITVDKGQGRVYMY